jgi:hypothetical protein
LLDFVTNIHACMGQSQEQVAHSVMREVELTATKSHLERHMTWKRIKVKAHDDAYSIFEVTPSGKIALPSSTWTKGVHSLLELKARPTELYRKVFTETGQSNSFSNEHYEPMDDNYDPPEIFPETDKEIMAISNDNYGEGEYISAAEVVAAVRATRHEAEPIGTLKEDHIDPRQRRLVFLRFDYKGVVTLRLVNTTVTNTRPNISRGARGLRDCGLGGSGLLPRAHRTQPSHQAQRRERCV